MISIGEKKAPEVLSEKDRDRENTIYSFYITSIIKKLFVGLID